MNISMLGNAVLAYAMVAAPAGQPTPVSTTFAFRFTVGSCTLDSAARTFSHDGEPRVSVPLELSEDQLREIAGMVGEVRFFEYPSTFVGVPLGLSAYSINVAAQRYRLEVQLAGKAHSVDWIDSTRPSTEEADRLRSLLERIDGFVGNARGFDRLRLGGVECK